MTISWVVVKLCLIHHVRVLDVSFAKAERLTLDHLNGEIELYTAILEKLQAAKATFYSPHGKNCRLRDLVQTSVDLREGFADSGP